VRLLDIGATSIDRYGPERYCCVAADAGECAKMFRNLSRRWGFALVLCAFAVTAVAQPSGAPSPRPAPTMALSQSPVDIAAAAATWVQAGGFSTVEQVVRSGSQFAVLPGRPTHSLENGKTLWMRVGVRREADAPADWVLQIPMPVLDSVTVYQRDATGQWKGLRAGDTIDVAAWPEPGRYPFFRVSLPPGETRELVLKVQHSTSLSLPVRLVPLAAHDARMQLEYMGLGLVFGAILLLIGLCAVRAWTLRDNGYTWYSLYAALSLLAVAAYTGIAGQLLWPGTGHWVDTSPGILALLSASAALLIVRSLSGVVTRHRWLGEVLFGFGLAGPFLAVVYFLIDRPGAVAILGLYLMAVAALSLAAAALAWARGDEVGVWMMAGALPLAFAVILVLFGVFGLLQSFWVAEYALVSAIALELPLLFGALQNRSRERRGAQFRQLASSSQDALTGLLSARMFQGRLAQAIARFRKRGEPAAVMLVEISNYAWIRETQGSAAAEQCLLRGVVQLRRLVRDVDTTGRVGEARFGLILEGVDTREVVKDRATRLIAGGLRSDADDGSDIALHFHVAAALLEEHSAEPAALIYALGDVLAGMSGGTRRPIRFLTPDGPQPSGPESTAAQLG
jgi:two-component system, sensor histidine kinase LadS